MCFYSCIWLCLYNFQYDASQVQPYGGNSLWSSTNVNYYAAAAVVFGVLLAYGVWLVFFNFGSGTLKGLEDKDEVDVTGTKDVGKGVGSKKSRRRRAIQVRNALFF